jgi:hypothetical protein
MKAQTRARNGGAHALRGLRFLPRPVIYVGLEEDEAGTQQPASEGVADPSGSASPQRITLPHSTKLPEL